MEKKVYIKDIRLATFDDVKNQINDNDYSSRTKFCLGNITDLNATVVPAIPYGNPNVAEGDFASYDFNVYMKDSFYFTYNNKNYNVNKISGFIWIEDELYLYQWLPTQPEEDGDVISYFIFFKITNIQDNFDSYEGIGIICDIDSINSDLKTGIHNLILASHQDKLNSRETSDIKVILRSGTNQYTVLTEYVRDVNYPILAICDGELYNIKLNSNSVEINKVGSDNSQLESINSAIETLQEDKANKSEIDTRIQNIVGAAPEALDTLEEIANKLGDNDDVHAALVNSIADKAPKEAFETLQSKLSNYCFNGIVDETNINSCRKEGYYIITGINLYGLLLVKDYHFDNECQQNFYKLHNNKFTIQTRSYTGDWSNWITCTINGDNILDSSITNAKIADNTITNAKLAEASIEPAAGKIPIADNDGILGVNSIKPKGFTVYYSSIGWYRIYEGPAVDNVLLFINLINDSNSNINNTYNLSINIGISSNNNQFPSITQLSGNYSYYINKIRVLTKTNGASCIDIYYNSSSSFKVNISGIGKGKFLTSVVTSVVPTDYTETEFKLTNGFKTNNTLNADSAIVANSVNIGHIIFGDNLNNYKTPGTTYYLDSGVGPGSYSPSKILKVTQDKKGIVQYIFEESGAIIRRTYNSSNDLWSSWYYCLYEYGLAKGINNNAVPIDVNSISLYEVGSYIIYNSNSTNYTNIPSEVSTPFSIEIKHVAGKYIETLTDKNNNVFVRTAYSSSSFSGEWTKVTDNTPKIVKLTEDEYNALSNKDANTLYCIPE